ncbi:helix-turn-helix transcriptional regulator [Amycolatopsis rhizosphaerae]|uniref:Helix-turn-helix transcriptional regulator n=1 Tax=Amycolatopsis rhizosphaerae TaxID=2053003 RepID=A0A558B267_9PSEU|nr:helix-turn-helix transcriptional regulator [Amycolatopsis rhizosphaerae]
MAAAEDLFYAEGIQAVGVERLLETSGVGRASFYRHFAGKDELVETVLSSRGQQWRRLLAEGVARRGGGPLAVFDFLADRFAREDYRGCAFINAMAEVGDADAAVYTLARQHKAAVTDYLDGLLEEAGHAGHAELAEQLMLLVDGALVAALRERGPAPAHRAKKIASALLASVH